MIHSRKNIAVNQTHQKGIFVMIKVPQGPESPQELFAKFSIYNDPQGPKIQALFCKQVQKVNS